MGLDGGTIISRSDVLRGASWRLASSSADQRSTRGGQLGSDFVAREESVGEEERRSAAWSCCAMTGEDLMAPVVACGLGRLYNKQSVVQFLLGRAGVFSEDRQEWQYLKLVSSSGNFDHIRSLRDVFEIVLERSGREAPQGINKEGTLRSTAPSSGTDSSGAEAQASKGTSSASQAAQLRVKGQQQGGGLRSSVHQEQLNNSVSSSRDGGSSFDGSSSRDGVAISRSSNSLRGFCCPITELPAGSRHKFCALRPCGHLLSWRAVREVKSAGCPVCAMHYTADDIIIVNGSKEEVDDLRKRMSLLKEKRKRKRSN